MAEIEPNLANQETTSRGEILVIFPLHLDSFMVFDLRPSFESAPKARYCGMTDIFSPLELGQMRHVWRNTEVPVFRNFERLIKRQIVRKMNQSRPELEGFPVIVSLYCDAPLAKLFGGKNWDEFWQKARGLVEIDSVRLMYKDLYLAEDRLRRSMRRAV